MEDRMGKAITVAAVIVLVALITAIAMFGVVPVLLPIAFLASAGMLVTLIIVAAGKDAY
jgi:hypothetical protein